MLGLVIVRKKTLQALEAGRKSADEHNKRLLHHAAENTLLWTAVRETGNLLQVVQIYKRLRGK